MIGSDIHKTGVPPDVVNAIGIRARNVGGGKVVASHHDRLFRGTPLLPRVGIVAEEFLLLRVHRNHRTAVRQTPLHCRVDVAELRVTVRMVSPLLSLPIALQAIVEVVKDLGHFRMADRVFHSGEFFRNRPRALANPPERRLRVAPCLVLDQLFQGVHQPRVRHRHRLASGSGPTNAAFHGCGTRVDFTDPFGDRLARQSARTPDQTHASMPQHDCFTGRHKAPRAFIQEWPNRPEFLRQFGQRTHSSSSILEVT